MKAEHRKELETNILADRMGRLVRKVKTRPKGRTLLYVFLTIVALLVLIIFWRLRLESAREASALWTDLEDGSRPSIDRLSGGLNWFAKQGKEESYGTTNAGKAARFQLAWFIFWERGVKFLSVAPQLALTELERAELMYLDLAEACKGDPLWEPEALYNLAVIEETRAVQDRDHLRKARELYEKLATNEEYKETAHGKLAAERAERLKQGSASYDAVAAFYQDFQNTHKVPAKAQAK